MRVNETIAEGGAAGTAAGRGAAPVGQVTWQRSGISRADRERKSGHPGRVLWLTGLPGSGKSTLAFALERELHARGIGCFVLDGDNVRHGLCRDLGFSEADRRENLRRVGEVAKLFVEAGTVVIAALVSPNGEDRRMVRDLFEEGDFAEIYVRCSLEECERRDPKGLYKKARSGQIPSFTGVGAPYDVPERPELTIDTQLESADESVAALIEYLEARGDLLGRLAEAGQV
ncbi:adenylylsulfate kinase [Cohnella sp. OV330]|uniref:adenylyl-sulfate kinase n=1 Tax=Cohnella sp. OV330 TaxID=1855288 RepID=UPI0008E60EF1|nr:adenylyl-sulfate kinase [Cohnella sp. OV330]SFB25306.1 adenylylsulfate kinase [Cohnella sp. OV330]